jgi:hypothetical protein
MLEPAVASPSPPMRALFRRLLLLFLCSISRRLYPALPLGASPSGSLLQTLRVPQQDLDTSLGVRVSLHSTRAWQDSL